MQTRFKTLITQLYLFLCTGVVNTGITWLAYMLLLNLVPWSLAYTLSFIMGVLLAFFLNATFVFKTEFSRKKMILFTASYLFQYGIGISLLYCFVSLFHLDARFAPLLILFFTVPLTFLLNRTIFQASGHPS